MIDLNFHLLTGTIPIVLFSNTNLICRRFNSSSFISTGKLIEELEFIFSKWSMKSAVKGFNKCHHISLHPPSSFSVCSVFTRISSICWNISQENGMVAEKTLPSTEVVLTATSWSSCCCLGDTVFKYVNWERFVLLTNSIQRSACHVCKSDLFKMSRFLLVSMKEMTAAKIGITLDSKHWLKHFLEKIKWEFTNCIILNHTASQNRS